MYAATRSTNAGFTWNDPVEQRLQSGHDILIVTDVHEFESNYLAYSDAQQLFLVGALDFRTGSLGYFRFGRDDARAMLRVGSPEPPWLKPLPFTLESVRRPHDNEERGRYAVQMVRTDITDTADLRKVTRLARQCFERDGFRPNSAPGMWRDLAIEVENSLITAELACAMAEPFTRRELEKRVHHRLGRKVDAARTLCKLVKASELIIHERGSSTTYEVAPAQEAAQVSG